MSIKDTDEIAEFVASVIEANPSEVDAYRGVRSELFFFCRSDSVCTRPELLLESLPR